MAKAKEIEGLDCGAEAGAGARLILSARFEEMRGYRAAALDWSDIEGVHDMRVASRRLRSAVRDFAPYMRRGGKRLDEARESLKRLADALGEVRDLDVEIAELEKLAAEAPDEEAAEGARLILAEREERRGLARARLTPEITEEALEDARRLLARALDPPRRRGKKKNGDDGERGESLAEAGDRIVLRLWDELRALSASLYRPLKTKPLHRMRIAAKRLRYAMELFAACRGRTLKKLASEVADLQKALGDLHDCDVWVEEFGGFLAEGSEDGGAHSAMRRRAALWLLEHFAEARTRHYRDALGIWRGWERDRFGARLAEALKGEGVDEEGADAQPAVAAGQ
ncbi:MAG TPA: CHAD domain-containing protein [Pyrinomonadaceae bacterium]|nr:CHAD domain-containing protein [Pyrinomonadaceae bacterium]